MKTGTLFTIGYAAHGADTRLVELMSQEHTMLIDIRFSPRSKRFPQWDGYALHAKWKYQYWQLGLSLGNINFHDKNKPVELARPEHGIKQVCFWLRKGMNVVLLCACADESKCHRLVVAKLVQDAMVMP